MHAMLSGFELYPRWVPLRTSTRDAIILSHYPFLTTVNKTLQTSRGTRFR